MFKKLNVKTLIILFVILLAIVLVVDLVDQKKGERTFRKEIVTLDTATVSSIIIKGRAGDDKEVKLFKSSDGWKVESGEKTHNADAAAVSRLLGELDKMKVERLAATKQEQWEKYEVNDSLGSRVIVMKDNEKLAEVIIGKFSYKQLGGQQQQMMMYGGGRQQQKMTSYVRVEGEDEVYAVDGFLRMTFRNDPDGFKDKNVVRLTSSACKALKFDYAGSNSFNVVKQEDKWMIDGILADSASTAGYLSSLSYLTSSNFIDDEARIQSMSSPTHKLIIEGDNMSPIEVTAAPVDSIFVISSSINKGTYFDGSQNDLFNKLFVQPSKFNGMGQAELTE